jgi:hypothetical protein
MISIAAYLVNHWHLHCQFVKMSRRNWKRTQYESQPKHSWPRHPGGKRTPPPSGTYWIRSWVGLELVWMSWRGEKLCPYRYSNSEPSAVYPRASHTNELNKVCPNFKGHNFYFSCRLEILSSRGFNVKVAVKWLCVSCSRVPGFVSQYGDQPSCEFSWFSYTRQENTRTLSLSRSRLLWDLPYLLIKIFLSFRAPHPVQEESIVKSFPLAVCVYARGLQRMARGAFCYGPPTILKKKQLFFPPVALQPNFGPWPPPWSFLFHFGYWI